MSEKEKASLAFPVTCMLISFTFTSYLHRAWISQQIRACKRLIRHTSRKTKRQIRLWAPLLHHITNSWSNENAGRAYNILEPSTGTLANHIGLTTYSADEPSLWDSDTSSDSTSNRNMHWDSNTSTTSEDPSPSPSPSLSSRPTWILDSTGQYILNRAPEPLPRAQWDIELDERIRNGHGPSVWLDRIIDWVVRRVVADFDAEMRAEIDRSGVDRRGMRGGMPGEMVHM